MTHRSIELMTGPHTDSTRFGIALFLILALSMIVTRDYHFSGALHLADTSWAVFLLAGLYLRPRWALPALLGLAVAVDLFTFWQDGSIRVACFSPAYPGLLFAYTALWGSGRLARRDWAETHDARGQWMKPLYLVGWTVAGVLVAFAISNLTFWAYSGHFPTLSLAEYIGRVGTYVPGYLSTTLMYTLLAIAGIIVWAKAMDRRRPIIAVSSKSA